eukprot:1890186-Amphidinium_carterae.3
MEFTHLKCIGGTQGFESGLLTLQLLHEQHRANFAVHTTNSMNHCTLPQSSINRLCLNLMHIKSTGHSIGPMGHTICTMPPFNPPLQI